MRAVRTATLQSRARPLGASQRPNADADDAVLDGDDDDKDDDGAAYVCVCVCVCV
jgi:hypothetical protein